MIAANNQKRDTRFSPYTVQESEEKVINRCKSLRKLNIEFELDKVDTSVVYKKAFDANSRRRSVHIEFYRKVISQKK